jgi:hypothetical protein
MNTLYYGDNLAIVRGFGVPPTNITLPQAERVREQGRRQGTLL